MIFQPFKFHDLPIMYEEIEKKRTPALWHTMSRGVELLATRVTSLSGHIEQCCVLKRQRNFYYTKCQTSLDLQNLYILA